MFNVYSWEELEYTFPGKFLMVLPVEYENLDEKSYEPSDKSETLYQVEDVSEMYQEGYLFIEGEDIFNY